MNYLIVGLGSIGKRHLNNIMRLEPDAHITVWHTSSQKKDDALLKKPHVRSVHSFEDALNPKPDVGLITNPASDHIAVAKKLAFKGIDLFIEKPLSSTLDGVDELIGIQHDQHTIIMVGYNLRFHPPVQILKNVVEGGRIGRIVGIRAEVGQYLPDWRPGSDYRSSVSARRELGGGAILELSHEIDYVRWIAGDVISVTAQAGHMSDLEINVEDVADIIMKHQNGVLSSVHLDMIQRTPARCCKIIGTEGTIFWDGSSDKVMEFMSGTSQWSELHPAQLIDRNLMYISEIEHFLTCVRTRKDPLVTVSEGKKVVQIAHAALRSSEENRSIWL